MQVQTQINTAGKIIDEIANYFNNTAIMNNEKIELPQLFMVEKKNKTKQIF